MFTLGLTRGGANYNCYFFVRKSFAIFFRLSPIPACYFAIDFCFEICMSVCIKGVQMRVAASQKVRDAFITGAHFKYRLARTTLNNTVFFKFNRIRNRLLLINKSSNINVINNNKICALTLITIAFKSVFFND